jgi:hypothetical protein
LIAPGANATYFEQKFVAPLPALQARGINNWEYTNQARVVLDDQISNLRRQYVFPDEQVVKDFLVAHRAVRALLSDAVPQLRATFGHANIFNLEISKDEDGSETLYAVAIWQADVRGAAEALDNFLENWWLQRMSAATSDLAFVYKLV